ncbi:MAG TPA: hypothetical protein VGL61_22840 [Kofleriaceae bacterium]|jgi:hypothetical protein
MTRLTQLDLATVTGGGFFSDLLGISKPDTGAVLGTATFPDGRKLDLDAIAEANARIRPR